MAESYRIIHSSRQSIIVHMKQNPLSSQQNIGIDWPQTTCPMARGGVHQGPTFYPICVTPVQSRKPLQEKVANLALLIPIAHMPHVTHVPLIVTSRGLHDIALDLQKDQQFFYVKVTNAACG